MRSIRSQILTVGLVALMAAPAFAQPQPGGRGRGQFQMTTARLLATPEVQTELKLTDDEKAAITKITDKYKDDLAAARAAQPRDNAKIADLSKQENDDVEKAVPTLLQPDQAKRLNQLKVQAAGLGAFTKDDVATALKLTDDQKKSIKDAEDGLQKDRQDLLQNAGQGADRAAAGQKIRTMTADALDKVVNGLTDDQKKTWKDLTGDKFEFPAPQRRPRNNNNQ